MTNAYLLVINGKPQGPFNVLQLKAMDVKPGDFVKSATMADYKEVQEVPELCGLLGIKYQITAPQYFGGLDQRLMAWALDWFFVMMGCLATALVSFIFVTGHDVHIAILIAIPVMAQAINFIYHVLMECSAGQATFGKQLIKLKVCDMEGRRLSFPRSLGRNAAKIFSSMTLGIGYLFCVFNTKQQCLHDMMAGTLVAKDRLI